MRNLTIWLRLGYVVGLIGVSFWFVEGAAQPETPTAPNLADFWEGQARWALDIIDVGLPIGESDSIYLGAGVYWSYLHASYQSAGVLDQCGEPVAFPGCLTRWESSDGGASFALTTPVCSIPCQRCPCDDQRDQITAQQYPRVFFTDDEKYLVYEWHAHTSLRTSTDGLNWSNWAEVRTPGGTWPSSYAPCSTVERIGPHPNIRGEVHDCLVGAPPGIYVEGDTLYIFVAAGSAPGHMRCYRGDRHAGVGGLRLCEHDPLFSGAPEYGPVEITGGAAADPYFDFRYVSSAEVIQVGERYYMLYEGVRGPDVLERGRDTQFGLGLARSVTSEIDGDWEKFRGNPILMPTSPNFGIGHADVVIVDGVTYLYTATSETTRGRYVLVWIDEQ